MRTRKSIWTHCLALSNFILSVPLSQPTTIMTHWYRLTKKSSNKKTGPIAVSTTSKDSCPATCPLKGNGCYADSGPLRLHWEIVSAGDQHAKPRGCTFEVFLSQIKSLAENSALRINQAGDLPHFNGSINRSHVLELATVCGERSLKAWTYTHHNLNDGDNKFTVLKANKLGLTVNVSAHSQQHAAYYHKQGLPAVCIVPKNEERTFWVYDDVSFIVCPAQTNKDMNCDTCRLCANANRKSVVAFRAHGNSARKVEQTIL